MKDKYTNERNIQMLIYLLKKNNIRKVIINPGTMNFSFVASIQNDNFFELYSCVDERSACYMACGLAAESNEVVVLTCTGATASRNYMPGMTEAFYRKLPLLAITCTPHLANIGQNIPQMIDRRVQLNDTFKYTTYISPIKNSNDEWNDTVLLNEAILELNHNGKGPVLINLGTELTKVFDCVELPEFRVMRRYYSYEELPRIVNKENIGIYIGNHEVIDEQLIQEIDKFCEKYNSVVICDHTSNYNGKYGIYANIICDQEKYISSLNNFDLLIHIGNTSGAYLSLNVNEVWRVNIDGHIRDTFKKLTNVYEMDEYTFFKKYNEMSDNFKLEFFEKWKKEYDEIVNCVDLEKIDFSNLWIAGKVLPKIPSGAKVHLAILNSLRSWNYFSSSNKVSYYCNTGGFGIDGFLSTLIGASFYDKNKNYFGITGDLAFFYDMNSLGNRYVGNNLRIMLINNGCGTEFHNYSHPASVIGDNNISDFIAADAHFGNKSKDLVRNYAENLGFEYITASSKKEFEKKLEYFVSNEIYKKPIIFEVFTNSTDESNALYKIRNLKKSISGEFKSNVNKVISPKLKSKIKGLIGR